MYSRRFVSYLEAAKHKNKSTDTNPHESGLVFLFFCLVMNVADGAIGQF